MPWRNWKADTESNSIHNDKGNLRFTSFKYPSFIILYHHGHRPHYEAYKAHASLSKCWREGMEPWISHENGHVAKSTKATCQIRKLATQHIYFLDNQIINLMKKAKKYFTTPHTNLNRSTQMASGAKPVQHTHYGSGYTITEDILM